ncbi:dynein heavy chain 10, axonemal [Plakobranchus ocellatus]|uniref:Dynein heavy chain 10, axonemal n=1 Tax=Plakobranchus ocellatus TaxID=259542 RepID=A0AAV4AN64_9GAST|nr:dynein heavy chain 10, axonemal [Plakobranchus ocellatus]
MFPFGHVSRGRCLGYRQAVRDEAAAQTAHSAAAHPKGDSHRGTPPQATGGFAKLQVIQTLHSPTVLSILKVIPIEAHRLKLQVDLLTYMLYRLHSQTVLSILKVIPIEAHRLKLQNTIRTPVYVTSQRRNAMGVGLVFEADLATKEHISHWVLQGLCLILNTD